MGGSSGVIPERSEIHIGVALDDPSRQGQGVGGGRGRLPAGPRVNAVVLRARGKAGLSEIHLETRMDSETAGRGKKWRAKNGKKRKRMAGGDGGRTATLRWWYWIWRQARRTSAKTAATTPQRRGGGGGGCFIAARRPPLLWLQDEMVG